MQATNRRAAGTTPARKKLRALPKAEPSLTEKRADPNTKRKQKVRKQTARTYIQRPRVLHGAVVDLGTPEAFGLKDKETEAVVYIAESLAECMREHLWRDTMFKKNVGVLRYDERLYLFIKSLVNCIEFANQSNNKPTEDQKRSFIEDVGRALKLLRDTYQPARFANPLRA